MEAGCRRPPEPAEPIDDRLDLMWRMLGVPTAREDGHVHSIAHSYHDLAWTSPLVVPPRGGPGRALRRRSGSGTSPLLLGGVAGADHPGAVLREDFLHLALDLRRSTPRARPMWIDHTSERTLVSKSRSARTSSRAAWRFWPPQPQNQAAQARRTTLTTGTARRCP